MDNNIDILNELNKGCDMGIEAIEMILDKVQDNDLKKLLEDFHKDYDYFSDDIKKLYLEYSNCELDKINMMEKAMAWYGIMKDTLLDSSNSKISEIMIQGTTMGIVEGRKILNHKKMDKRIHSLCEKFVNTQEKYVEKLKKYL